MGIVDIKFNKINTNVALSCLDSTIKIYDIDTSICLFIQKRKLMSLSVKLWKIGKFSMWPIILLLLVMLVGLDSLILSPRKR
jgi:hypothetical protein